MSVLFIISNEHGHFYSKQKDWTDGKQRGNLFRARHYDEALNLLLELNARDISLRAQVLEAEPDKRGEPFVTISDIPLPISERRFIESSNEQVPNEQDNQTLDGAIEQTTEN